MGCTIKLGKVKTIKDFKILNDASFLTFTGELVICGQVDEEQIKKFSNLDWNKITS